MKDFKHGSKFDRHESGGYQKKGFNKFDNRRGFGGSSFDKPSYPATCAECGDRCEVPFKPVNGRPVFCKNCFRHEDGRSDFNQREERHGFDRREERPAQNRQFNTAPAQDYKRDFMELNRKLDEVMAAIRELKALSASTTAESIGTEEPAGEAEEAEAEKEAPKKKKAAKSKEKATKKKK